MADNYIIGNFQADDDIVIPQDDLHSLAWETESNLSLLDHSKNYRDPITIEESDSRDSLTQQSENGKLPPTHNIASNSIADAAQPDTY